MATLPEKNAAARTELLQNQRHPHRVPRPGTRNVLPENHHSTPQKRKNCRLQLDCSRRVCACVFVQMMESSLQSIINFCTMLHRHPKGKERHQPVLATLIKEEGMWEQLQKLSSELKNRSGAFYKTLKYRAKRGECTDGLFVLMSFNSYYGSPTQE